MSKEEINRKLKRILLSLIGDSIFDMETIQYVDLLDDAQMDSLMFISIVIEIEESFDIIVPDDKMVMEKFRTLSEIAQIIYDTKKLL